MAKHRQRRVHRSRVPVTELRRRQRPPRANFDVIAWIPGQRQRLAAVGTAGVMSAAALVGYGVLASATPIGVSPGGPPLWAAPWLPPADGHGPALGGVGVGSLPFGAVSSRMAPIGVTVPAAGLTELTGPAPPAPAPAPVVGHPVKPVGAPCPPPPTQRPQPKTQPKSQATSVAEPAAKPAAKPTKPTVKAKPESTSKPKSGGGGLIGKTTRLLTVPHG